MKRKTYILFLVVFCFIAINELLYSSIKNRVQLKFDSVRKVSLHSVPESSIDNMGGRKVNWEEIVPDWNRTEFCDRYLDNETHIFKQFKQHGYTTLQMEDWADTMIDSYPSCDGFYERPADHIFRPFLSFYESYGTKITKNHLDGKLCREYHHAMMDHLQQAINAYSDRPLFSWTWLTDIGHDFSNGPYRIDQSIIDYFEKNRQVFDDSFVLFVSDHGFRIGDTEIDMSDFSTNRIPTLWTVIPYQFPMKKGTLCYGNNQNPRELVEHFPFRNSTVFVKWKSTKCWSDNSLMTSFGQKVIDHVHKLLDESNFTSICHHYQLKEVTSLIEYGYSTLWNTYEIEVKTHEPSAVHFQTMMTFDPKTETMNFEKVVRLDKYGDTADCTASVHLEPLCRCKKLIDSLGFLNYFNYLF